MCDSAATVLRRKCDGNATVCDRRLGWEAGAAGEAWGRAQGSIESTIARAFCFGNGRMS